MAHEIQAAGSTGSRAKTYLAVDLGGSSGRVMAGHFDGATLRIEEVARFPNHGVQRADGWHWDVERLWSGITQGLAAAAGRFGPRIVSVGVDTWGVDYVLIDAEGRPLNEPWMYRDSRTDGLIDRAEGLAGPGRIWGRTGIQPLFFNTIYQLMAEAERNAAGLRQARGLLFMPDFISFRLCGVRAIERSIASTSGLLVAGTAEWDVELAATLGIPPSILGPVTEPARILGDVTAAIAAETGLRGVKVATCGSHDTASAVAGVPARSRPLFISSGTWSILGIELTRPIVDDTTRRAGFSNEQGLEGTTRLLANIAGMWLLQECSRAWSEQGRPMGYAEMAEAAATCRAPALIDPDAAEFQKPCDMPATIRRWVRETGQSPAETDAELIRTILESLALKYGRMVRRLAGIVPEMPDTLHIVGGGCQNRLLNQLTADATGWRVEAGPVEATAAGNVLAQMMASGDVASLAEGRELMRRSFALEVHEPRGEPEWRAKAKRFDELLPT